jgi:hypothetical protein
MGRARALAVILSVEDYDAELSQQNGSITGDNDWSSAGSRVPPPRLVQAASDATSKIANAL